MNELLGIERISTNGGISEVRKFTYDADGNMTSDGRGIYSYDGFNRMSEAVMEDGGKLICRYDTEGLRHEAEENGFTRYIRGNGRLVASDSESARTYYHYACDSLGSVDFVLAGNEFECDEICDDVKQRVLCRYKYDAFGNVTDSVENVGNRFGFTGEMLDDVTGQYYLRARYYVPEIGRFTQADTFHGDGLNLYVYAGNNPVRYVDPDGHCCKGGDVYRINSDTNLKIMSRNSGRGNPNAIIHFGFELNTRQNKLLNQLPYYDSSIIVKKSDVNLNDLSALTAKTGNEFAMFTRGSQRLIIRGGINNVNIDGVRAQELFKAGYKWSGHTHPGMGYNVKMPSSGDKFILKMFEQNQSVIYDNTGKFEIFGGN